LTTGAGRDQDAAAGRDIPASEGEEGRGGQRMTAARIIEAIGSLLWPLLVAVLLVRVIPHIPGVVADLRRAMRTRAFTVKIGGVELSVEEAAEQLRRQVADLQTHMAIQLAERAEGAEGAGRAGPAPPGATPPGSPGAGPPSPPGAGAAREQVPARADQGPPTILWVDDDPDDRTMELAKLRDDGVEVLLARSTAEAMDVLSLRRGVHAIVTDLGRAEDGEFRSHAGLALLRQLREAEQDQPVLVYTSARRVELDRQDALDAGASVVTASPTELFAALRRILAIPAGRHGTHAPATPPRSAERPRRPIRPG
jgi:CheY-like chemotaxis protein